MKCFEYTIPYAKTYLLYQAYAKFYDLFFYIYSLVVYYIISILNNKYKYFEQIVNLFTL